MNLARWPSLERVLEGQTISSLPWTGHQAALAGYASMASNSTGVYIERRHIGYTFVQGSAITCKMGGLFWEKLGKRPETKKPRNSHNRLISELFGLWG